MKTYEKYKDSEIEWIGEIPEHWEVKRFGLIFSFYRGLPITKQDLKDEGIPCVSYGEIHSKYGFYVDPAKHDLKFVDDIYLNSSGNSLLNRGDFVFADTSEDIKGSGNFTCLNSDIPTFAGYHTIIARQKMNHNYKYLAYYFDSIGFRNQIRREVSGIKVFSITQGILKSTRLLLPNFEDQVIIANFLDRKTAEIDRIIANKQKLIALYEEEKQAIINQAVTKGIWSLSGAETPTVKLKDSGVEWLGEIPEHWKVKKLNYCFGQIGSGTTPTSGKTEYYENGEYNWLQTGDLNDSEIVETSKKITQKALDEISTLRFYPIDSIVIAMYGATIGKTGILKIESTTNQACCVLSKPKKMLPKFVFYWFGSVKKHIISLSYGGGQPNINQEQIRSLKIQQPTIDEQQTIIAHIEKECTRLDTIIEKFNKQIELLQEYRTTLISDVVTGKVKVMD